MIERRIRVSYGRTCQSAPYESIRLDIAVEETVPDGESVKDHTDKIVNWSRKYVKSKIAETLKNE
jgi:hypothetical protein